LADLSAGLNVTTDCQDTRLPYALSTPFADRPAGCGSTYVVTDDVDSVYARAKAAGAKIVRELEDTDYGNHEFSLADAEGNLWSFGTYRGA
jgi:uncharacterized glyoxalase superfamily protein PhnB